MWLWSIRPDGSRGPFTIQDYVDLGERDLGAQSVAAFAPWSANLTGVGTAERLQGMRTSANAFSVLRVAAVAGRTFLPEEAADGRWSSSDTDSGRGASAPIPPSSAGC